MKQKRSASAKSNLILFPGLDAGPAGKRARRKQGAGAPPSQVFELKITLRDIEPPIWRRVVVPNNYTLAELHDVIQAAMGWMGGHMHGFRSAPPGFRQPEEIPETLPLSVVFTRQGQRIRYVYDFGDCWEHTILVEKVLPYEAQGVYPRCLDGARACPPEDSGGPPGYLHILDALRHPGPENAEQRAWLGSGFDPEAFDRESVNRRLAALGKRRRGTPGR